MAAGVAGPKELCRDEHPPGRDEEMPLGVTGRPDVHRDTQAPPSSAGQADHSLQAASTSPRLARNTLGAEVMQCRSSTGVPPRHEPACAI